MVFFGSYFLLVVQRHYVQRHQIIDSSASLYKSSWLPYAPTSLTLAAGTLIEKFTNKFKAWKDYRGVCGKHRIGSKDQLVDVGFKFAVHSRLRASEKEIITKKLSEKHQVPDPDYIELGFTQVLKMEMKPREAENENLNEQTTREMPQCCSWCHKVHTTVSNWMLPEDNRSRYMERANCLPPPIFIISISLAELAVFIYYAVWMPQKQWITMDKGVWESPFIYRPDKRKEAWRFVSYMLVHAGVQHIIGNLFMQLILGIPLELVHKGFRVGLVYLAGVIGGSLASSIFDPMLGLVGASGGGYALMGGYFMNVIVCKEDKTWKEKHTLMHSCG
ncbi:rhomboid-related protein 2 isoform X2 [Heptranchias perlo]|uniref:rhomboid-related protein 2 isoform X2 n=1 Tax=Heptranchias perlo TaxID=212740 RepID=UPI003559BFB9